MARKLLSFIGPTKYVKSHYVYNDKKSGLCNFIQEALVEFFCKDEKCDQIVIFMTEESRKKNWLGKDEYKDANFNEGLRRRLEKIKKSLNIDFEIKDVRIPEGRNENELWEIFEMINNNIDEGDRIIFDITHSFRSLPILVLVALNYVRFLKNIRIEQIVYGALEALGSIREVEKMPEEKRFIPIFNLTPFASLFDWTIAVERFLQTGNAEMISRIGIEELKPMLAKTRGVVGGKLRRLIETLNKFSQDVLTCRAPELKSDIKEILDKIPEAERELKNLRPFKPLFEKVKERFSKMQINDDVSVGLEIASWCLEKGLIQQGITILRETIVNYVILKVLKSKELKKPGRREDPDYREIAEAMLNNKYKGIPKDILNLWNEIGDYRNDINHAGWRTQNYHSSNSFARKLKEFLEKAQKLNLN